VLPSTLDQNICHVNRQPLTVSSQESTDLGKSAALLAGSLVDCNRNITDGQSSRPLQEDAVMQPCLVVTSCAAVAPAVSRENGVPVVRDLPRKSVSAVMPVGAKSDPRKNSNKEGVDRLTALSSNEAAQTVSACTVTSIADAHDGQKMNSPLVCDLLRDSVSALRSVGDNSDSSKNSDKAEVDCLVAQCSNKAAQTANAFSVTANGDDQGGQKISSSPSPVVSEIRSRNHYEEPGEDGTPVSSFCKPVVAAAAGRRKFFYKLYRLCCITVALCSTFDCGFIVRWFIHRLSYL